jgi:hypothetical protein
MTLADTTFVSIAKAIQETKLKMSKYILDDDYISDSEEEDQNRDEINQKLGAHIKKHHLE